jgi:ATP phosphoribosyltransferase regulatory subunit HisZ
VGSLANDLRLVALAVNALSAFDNFYFFLGHKQIRRAGLQSG